MAIHLNLSPTTVALLNELAGGERRKSEYLDRIVPILHRATIAGIETRRHQQVQAIAEAVAEALDKQAEAGV